MKIQQLFACLGATALFSSAAMAAPTQTFTMVSDGNYGFTASYGNSFAAADYNHTFDNKYYFTTSTFFQGAVDLTSSFTTNKDLLITQLELVSYNPSTHQTTHTYFGTNETATGSKRDIWSLDVDKIPYGSYYLEVTGKVLGKQGGSYGGTLNVEAVPEPESYGMMVAGLGLLGFVARRRRGANA